MRITGGAHKGREIECPAGVRPVSTRVRKAYTDVLAAVIPGARILDLFAGAGMLSFESLSLGAAEVTCVDRHPPCTAHIRRVAGRLAPRARIEIVTQDSMEALRRWGRRKREFDLILADPPYSQGLVKKTLHTLREYDIVAPSGFVVCFCHLKDEYPEAHTTLKLRLKKKYGQTLLLVYEKKESGAGQAFQFVKESK
ncbi:MAG: methyltransferase [Candidatus Omnitrophica bacterium]|nr:methyltransferase [Candidatus Omnitrophota bacterium]